MKVSPNRYLGSPGRPSWSADGKRVAVSLNREAVIVDRESEAVTSRVGPEGANVGAPQFAPSGEQIAYDLYDSEQKQWKIQVSRADGSEARTVVPHGRTPRWSPDGESIAFASYTDDFQTKVSVVDVQGGGQREVSARPHSHDFSWSPDGSKIAYEAIGEARYELRSVEVESGQEQFLSDGGGGAYYDRSPVWSPSGKTIAFERRHKNFPAASLWTVDSTTGTEKQLLQELADVVDPVFSPDGQTLVFGSNHGGRGGLDLFTMDLASLRLTQLTDQRGDEHSPSFSPDGSTIAFFNTDRRRAAGETTELHFREV